jgi:hypothetical protein
MSQCAPASPGPDDDHVIMLGHHPTVAAEPAGGIPLTG